MRQNGRACFLIAFSWNGFGECEETHKRECKRWSGVEYVRVVVRGGVEEREKRVGEEREEGQKDKKILRLRRRATQMRKKGL